MTRPAIQPDPFTKGSTVRVIAGEHAGKRGTVQKAYRGRPCGLDRIYVDLDGGPVGWSVALRPEELESIT
jgi:hypothetical protein